MPLLNNKELQWLTLKAANGLQIPYVGYVLLDFEVAGVSVRDKGAIIVKDSCLGPEKAILGMNVIFSCWESLFQGTHPGTTAFKVTVSPAAHNHWERAFAVCNSVAQHQLTDGKIGVARMTKNVSVEVPPQSEIVVWANVLGAAQLPHGDVLVEGTMVGTEWQVARSLCSFTGGKIPVRLQNVSPYPITIPPRQVLASVFLLSNKQICTEQEMVLTTTDSQTVEIDIRAAHTSPPADHPVHTLQGEDLCPEQQAKMNDLLQRWSSVFAASEDDFGCTSAVLHQIPTGTAPPSRERYRPIPPSLYPEYPAQKHARPRSGSRKF